MVVFFSDLDNTLIYSYRHDIGKKKRCVEIYQGREVSFVTDDTYELLREVKERMLFVPVTTRTIEQYERIDLKIGAITYALVCNGGVLLKDGQEDISWYEESLELVSDCRDELCRAEIMMVVDENRDFEVRNIRNLFLFTKSSKPIQSAEALKQRLDGRRVEVFSNGVKVYVVPKALNKGAAVRRLRNKLCAEKLNAETVIAAGDSEFDIPMLTEADISFAPGELANVHQIGKKVITIPKTRIFSEEVLKYIIKESQMREECAK